MLRLADRLTADKVDAILARFLPEEKSARRRINKLESFIFTESQEYYNWLQTFLSSNKIPSYEEVMEKVEAAPLQITIESLLRFEIYIREEKAQRGARTQNTPAITEKMKMMSQPCRWEAKHNSNRNIKESKKSSGVIYESVLAKLMGESCPLTAKDIFNTITGILEWHPEIENDDKVTECRWNKDNEEWELVVVKPDGRVVGNPSKTIEDVLKEEITGRSRTTGVSGRKLNLNDAFLGILMDS